MQPSDSNVLRCAFTALRMRESKVAAPPRSLNQATRVPLRLRSRLPAKREPGSLIEMGQRASGPAITLNSRAVSATLRAIGPVTLRVDQALPRAGDATRPGDVLNPTTLQKA